MRVDLHLDGHRTFATVGINLAGPKFSLIQRHPQRISCAHPSALAVTGAHRAHDPPPGRPLPSLRPRRRPLTSAGAHSPPTAPTAVGRIGLFALGPVPSARLLLRRLGPLAHALPEPA